MKWLRRIGSRPRQEPDVSRARVLNIQGTIPTSMLLGRTLVGLWGAHWTSGSCNQAVFAYELDNGSAVVFPESPVETAFLECLLVDLQPSFCRLSQVVYGETDDPRIIGCRISDLLVPADPECRFPDSQVLLMSSGYGIAAESGEPHGILPALYLVHRIEQGLVSMFTTSEWEHYRRTAGRP